MDVQYIIIILYIERGGCQQYTPNTRNNSLSLKSQTFFCCCVLLLVLLCLVLFLSSSSRGYSMYSCSSSYGRKVVLLAVERLPRSMYVVCTECVGVASRFWTLGREPLVSVQHLLFDQFSPWWTMKKTMMSKRATSYQWGFLLLAKKQFCPCRCTRKPGDYY